MIGNIPRPGASNPRLARGSPLNRPLQNLSLHCAALDVEALTYAGDSYSNRDVKKIGSESDF